MLYAFAIACGGNNGDNDSSDPVSIRGTERLSWDQAADSAQQLKALTFKIYVDGNSAPFEDTRCADTSAGGAFACSGKLPPMSPGRHTLELTAVRNGVESPRSPQLLVDVSATSSTLSTAPSAPETARLISGRVVCTASTSREECYDVRPIATGLEDVAAMAPTPDGRVLVVDGSRVVRVIERNIFLPDPALVLPDVNARIVGLAIDPQFERSHTVFVAWSEPDRDGSFVVNITRFREVAGTLGEGAVIVSGLALPDRALAPLAIGADGSVYVALPGAPGDRIAEREPFNGTLLRYERDGTTSRISLRASPVVSRGYTTPSGIALDAATGQIFFAGSVDDRLSAATLTLSPDHSTSAQPFAIPTPALSLYGRGPAMAIASVENGTSLLLAARSNVLLARLDEGKLSGFEHLRLDDGLSVTSAAAARDGWYLGTTSDSGQSEILHLRPTR
jgi:hypothetical protein